MTIRKIILYLNVLMFFLFVILTVYAVHDTVTMYETYGYSYEVVKTINGNASIETVTLTSKIATCTFSIGLSILFFSNVLLYQQESSKIL